MGELEVTHWSVIRRVRAGEIEARAEFARTYGPVVRAFLLARWRGTSLVSEVEDAAQDVFVDLLRPNGAVERADSTLPGGFRAYLYGVVRNVARRVEERRARRREVNVDSSFPPPEPANREEPVSHAFDRAWARSLLRQAAALQRARAAAAGPEALRRVELLQLRFARDMPIREIAALWGEDPARLHRMYAQAREEFKDAVRAVAEELEPGLSTEAACRRLLEHLG
jgi:RNA polymerase sigma-70 factor (ECF subfamily)